MNHSSIIPTRHCQLCEHQELSLKEGSTCGLTGNKPDFNNTCIKIQLGEKFKGLVKSTNTEFEHLKSMALKEYSVFTGLLIIGLLFIIGGIWIGQHIVANGVIGKLPVIIIGASLGPLTAATRGIVHFRQEFYAAKERKKRIDEVIKLYNISYTFQFTVRDETYGIEKFDVDLKFKGLR